MTFLEWLVAPEGTPAPWRAPEKVGRIAAAASSLGEEPRAEVAVRPIPAIGSDGYRRACLKGKFWIATSVHLPAATALQRELQGLVRTPGFDPWQAAEILRGIEAVAREVQP